MLEAPVDAGAPVATPTYTVGGKVSGLAGSGLVLGAADARAVVAKDGVFTFDKPVASGVAYDVKVVTQPASPSQTCQVAKGSGKVAGKAVIDVEVTCATNAYAVGGSVVGLHGQGLELEMVGGETIAVAASGAFAFPSRIPSGQPFAVSVKKQPAGKAQTCTVAGDHGTVVAADVTTVVVSCLTDGFAVGGAVSGLASSVVLSNAGVDTTVTANGTFALEPVEDGAPYEVTIKTQPTSPWQTCVLDHASGTIAGAAVSDVSLVCTTNSYAVGGSVAGLVGSGLVVQQSAGDDVAVAATDATFAFATPVVSGQPYAVTVKTQPTSPSQTCVVSSGTGTVGGVDVVTPVVTCTTDTYALRVAVSGLFAEPIVLQNGADELTFAADGSQAFAVPVASGASYAVSIKTAPSDINCAVVSGSGSMVDVAKTVQVTCSAIFTDVPPTLFAGYTQCFQELYNVAGTTLQTRTAAACTKAKIVVGCRKVGDTNLTVAAAGARADVFFDVGTGSAATHDDAHGVSWYYTAGAGSSMGFAPAGAGVQRSSADVSSVQSDKRLSWHTGQGSGGYRCGATMGLNGSSAWERIMLHAD